MRGWGPSIVSYLKCYGAVHGSTVPIVGLVQQKNSSDLPKMA